MVYSHQTGLYADLCACLDAQGLRVVRCDLQAVGHLQMHRFWVVDNATAFKLEHSLLTPVSLAVRDAVVQPSIWKRTHGSGAGMVEAKQPDGNQTVMRRNLSIRAPDRPGLIRDVSLSLVADEVDVETVVAHTAVRSDGLVDAVFEATVRADRHRLLRSAAPLGGVGGEDAVWDGVVSRATRAAELGMEAPDARAARGDRRHAGVAATTDDRGDDRGEEQGASDGDGPRRRERRRHLAKCRPRNRVVAAPAGGVHR